MSFIVFLMETLTIIKFLLLLRIRRKLCPHVVLAPLLIDYAL